MNKPEPNMVVVRLEGNLHSFNIINGQLEEWSTQFSSDYDINERQIVLAQYNEDEQSSRELLRITLLHEDEEEIVLNCMKRGEFEDVIYELLEHYNAKPTVH